MGGHNWPRPPQEPGASSGHITELLLPVGKGSPSWLSLSSVFFGTPGMYLSCPSGARFAKSLCKLKGLAPSLLLPPPLNSPPFLIKAFNSPGVYCLMKSIQTNRAGPTQTPKGSRPPILTPSLSPPKKRISPCHSYSSKRKLLLFVKEALKSRDMKGKSSLREEGHGVRGEIKGAIFPPRRESSAKPPRAGRGAGEGAMRGAPGCHPGGSRPPLVPSRHLPAVREGNGWKVVKSPASTPKRHPGSIQEDGSPLGCSGSGTPTEGHGVLRAPSQGCFPVGDRTQAGDCPCPNCPKFCTHLCQLWCGPPPSTLPVPRHCQPPWSSGHG